MAIKRVLCEQVFYADFAKGLLQRVRKHKGKEWSTTLDGVDDYRAKLLELQKNRCAYCQTTILADQNGLRELDHVLPKNESHKCDSKKSISSSFDDRFHTKGYEKFRFEPRNLILTCKQCNNHKGSFDPLANRDKAISLYPTKPIKYSWVHPFFHKYSEHVEITPNWFYISLTAEGSNLIRVCKLDKAEVLSRRKMAEAYAAQSNSLTECLSKIGPQCQNLSFEECVYTLVEKFFINKDDAEALIAAWFEYGSEINSKTHERALKLTRIVQAKLQRLARKKSAHNSAAHT